MNIEQAKAISIVQILEIIGIKPTRLNQKEAWYLSPLRHEKTASFKVNLKRNLWYDFGIDVGGHCVKFICALLESKRLPYSESDALHWLDNISQNLIGEQTVSKDRPSDVNDDPKLVIKSVRSIQHRALIHYLESRGIPLTLASRVLQEVRVKNIVTEKNMFALGLQNEEGGYELRNPIFKGCIAPKDITFLRGKQPEGIHIFEGCFDYLSVLAQREGRPFEDDTIILNSLSCTKKAYPYIRNYGYKAAYTWLDNDLPGRKKLLTLDAFLKNEHGLLHKPMNALYRPYKDVNAHHMQSLGL